MAGISGPTGEIGDTRTGRLLVTARGVNCRVIAAIMALIAACCLALGIGPGKAALSVVRADEAAADHDDAAAAARRGYRFLTEKAYVPPALNERLFSEVWRVWPEPLRSEAERAGPTERRRLAFQRYGLTARPADPRPSDSRQVDSRQVDSRPADPRPADPSAKPLQYVVDAQGNWSMNCFACHGGSVVEQVIPGLPNSRFALETLIDEIRDVKLLLGEPVTRADLATVLMPMGTTRGTTNAVMFGVILMAHRTPDLQVKPGLHVPQLLHHDMDAPPWWHFRKRSHLYLDGHAQKGHRGLMQFMLVKENGPEKFREWEADFRDVYAFLESVRPPRYPYAIDEQRASRGETVFVDHCARCHGTYGEKSEYPEVMVPLDEIGTDRARFDALTPRMRALYGESWFADFGKHDTVESPSGYVAPPLDGLWASAPYFHNGSVPTLWHVLHSTERPAVWKQKAGEYDREKVGLSVDTWRELPADADTSKAVRREYFDTRVRGKSASGHTFPDELSEADRVDLLEYLKKL